MALTFDRYDRSFPGEEHGLYWDNYNNQWVGKAPDPAALDPRLAAAQSSPYSADQTVTPDRNTGAPLSREHFLPLLMAGGKPNYFAGQEGASTSEADLNRQIEQDAAARKMLALFDQYGVNNATELPPEVRAQLPNGGTYVSRGGMSFGGQLVDFVTSPAFLLAAGPVAGMLAGAAAGAGAGSATTGAAGGTAGGTGITAGASGASGLSTTASGASGISTAGAAGTSLAPGFFSAETVGGLGSALASGGGSGGSTAPQTGGGTQPTPQQQTALSKVLNGTATADDYMRLFGQVAPSLLGMYASDRQADAFADQAARYEAMGAPYRERLGELYSDPTAFLNSPDVKVPVQQGTDALARALSTQGNPAGSGSALHTLQNYASNQLFGRLGQEKDRLAGFGGLTAYNQAAPGLGANAIDAGRGFYDALGHGIGAVTNPPRSLEDMLRAYNISQGLT